MTEKQKQIYRLGQVYGYICEKHGHWAGNAHDTQAALHPLQGVTIALFATLKMDEGARLKADDKYIVYRMDTIKPEIGEITCSLDEQGIFTLGKMQIHRTVKNLIEMTGLTQAQLAERIGVTALTVGRWYRGDVPISERGRFQIEDIILDK